MSKLLIVLILLCPDIWFIIYMIEPEILLYAYGNMNVAKANCIDVATKEEHDRIIPLQVYLIITLSLGSIETDRVISETVLY